MNDSDEEKDLAKDILSDKNCLITGATGGLGKEIAKLFVKKKLQFIFNRNN